MIKPVGFDTWNPALRGAYTKGWRAAKGGQPRTACPYVDKRKVDGRLTWGRAFRSAWIDAWTTANALASPAPLTAAGQAHHGPQLGGAHGG
jgi:hypothetical protein